MKIKRITQGAGFLQTPEYCSSELHSAKPTKLTYGYYAFCENGDMIVVCPSCRVEISLRQKDAYALPNF